jgi:tartrate-resistant acid phosphatase type 5
MKAFDGDDLSFLVIGDWGGLPDSPYRTVIELDVADTMTKYAKAYNTKFQIALGDNFYFDGVKNAKDQRFQVKSIVYKKYLLTIC